MGLERYVTGVIILFNTEKIDKDYEIREPLRGTSENQFQNSKDPNVLNAIAI